MNKIKTLGVLRKIVNKLKRQNKRIVFTNGCFDILHPGHIKLLKKAKEKGDILIVGLNSDSSIKRIKGEEKPILNEKARAQLLEALEVVDYIVLFKEDTPYELIKQIKPHFLVKGSDWEESKIIGREFAGKVCRVKLYSKYSTTQIINKIKNAR